jgi:hypothetical protein
MMSLKRAGALERLGRAAEAEVQLKESIGLLEQRQQPSFLQMEAYYAMGRLALILGRPKEARGWYLRSTDFVRRTKKGNVEGAANAMCAAGLAAFDVGDVEAALADWRCGLLATNPKTMEFYTRATFTAMRNRLDTLERTRPEEARAIRAMLEAVPTRPEKELSAHASELFARAEAELAKLAGGGNNK